MHATGVYRKPSILHSRGETDSEPLFEGRVRYELFRVCFQFARRENARKASPWGGRQSLCSCGEPVYILGGLYWDALVLGICFFAGWRPSVAMKRNPPVNKGNFLLNKGTSEQSEMHFSRCPTSTPGHKCHRENNAWNRALTPESRMQALKCRVMPYVTSCLVSLRI